jgi:hypothetical protein
MLEKWAWGCERGLGTAELVMVLAGIVVVEIEGWAHGTAVVEIEALVKMLVDIVVVEIGVLAKVLEVVGNYFATIDWANLKGTFWTQTRKTSKASYKNLIKKKAQSCMGELAGGLEME